MSLLIVSFLLMCVGCGGSNADPAAAPSDPPTLISGTVAATGNPLVAQYTISPSAPASVAVEFGPDQSYGFSTSSQTSATNGQVSILVAGMKQNTTYHMRAIVTYNDGSQQFDMDHTFLTGTIPSQRVPSITVTNASGSPPSQGIDLISLTIGNANQLLALATDPAGNVIWYYDYGSSLGIPQPIKLLPNGHMLLVLSNVPPTTPSTVREIDLAGNVIKEFDSNTLGQKLQAAGYNLQVLSIDHDFVLLPNGHLLLIITDTKTFNDLPGYPGQTVVMGNAIVDLDANGNPAWVWDAFDHLDVNRHPIFFPDWTHANALVYSQDDGNLLFSLRHQSWILKIDYRNGAGAGDILWKLGYQGDFTLQNSSSASDWFFAQHDANFASSNTTGQIQLAMFDNGDGRPVDANGTQCAGLVAPLCFSTGAIFQVDETARTASRWWSYTTPYSFWGGNTRVLPNSNLLVDETAPGDLNLTGSRVVEVTQSPNPQVVRTMLINGQNSYRTIRLPSLYPGVQW